MGKRITDANYNKDRYYRRIANASGKLLMEKGYIAPVDLLMEMDLLRKKDHEDWRHGRIPYLERVIQ